MFEYSFFLLVYRLGYFGIAASYVSYGAFRKNDLPEGKAEIQTLDCA